jgi:hypothetical protein
MILGGRDWASFGSLCLSFSFDSYRYLSLSADIIPPIDGSTDYVVPLDPLDASSPGTLIIGADGKPMFDFGRVAVGNGATSARWVRDRIKVCIYIYIYICVGGEGTRVRARVRLRVRADGSRLTFDVPSFYTPYHNRTKRMIACLALLCRLPSWPYRFGLRR